MIPKVVCSETNGEDLLYERNDWYTGLVCVVEFTVVSGNTPPNPPPRAPSARESEKERRGRKKEEIRKK